MRTLFEIDIGPDRFDKSAQLPAQTRTEQFFFGAVVQVEHRLGNLGRGGDAVHRGLVVAVHREHLHRGVEHLLLAHRARQTFGTAGPTGHG